MKSVFVTGTGTDVGKTVVASGVAYSMRTNGLDVGVMKPYSAGPLRPPGALTEDAYVLAEAANVSPSPEINPCHQDMAAPPYFSGVSPVVSPADMVSKFKLLATCHDTMVVEGMGGAMVPLGRDYFLADLARDMDLPVVVVTDNRVGSINHTVMTVLSCRYRKTTVLGIVLNMIHDGYDAVMMSDTLYDILATPILGVLPRVDGYVSAAKHLNIDAPQNAMPYHNVSY